MTLPLALFAVVDHVNKLAELLSYFEVKRTFVCHKTVTAPSSMHSGTRYCRRCKLNVQPLVVKV